MLLSIGGAASSSLRGVMPALRQVSPSTTSAHWDASKNVCILSLLPQIPDSAMVQRCWVPALLAKCLFGNLVIDQENEIWGNATAIKTEILQFCFVLFPKCNVKKKCLAGASLEARLSVTLPVRAACVPNGARGARAARCLKYDWHTWLRQHF